MDKPISSDPQKVGIDSLDSKFLSLRIGESIPRLEIKEIRKVSGQDGTDNLSGVDYKYLIETTDQKLLTVNAWALWNKIAAALRQAGHTNVVLELKHPSSGEYAVRLV
ncbi:MAG: hypothetical protein GY847_23655 [Proteobacteria bacterium]|nr:hypothetical protein [Pseudomonadota bacterium]